MASHSVKQSSASSKKVRKNYKKQITLKKRTCYKCKAHFRTEKSLIKHIKECSGSQKQESVICHLCGKGFPDRASIEKHLKAHTKTPCCFCTMCKKTFAEFEDLESHISVCKVLRLRRKEVRKAFIRKHQIFKRLEQIEVFSENESSSETIVSPGKTEDVDGYVHSGTKDNSNLQGNNTIKVNQLDKNTINMNNHQFEKNITIGMDKTNTVSINNHHIFENSDKNGHQLDETAKKSHDTMDADLDFLCENCGLQFEGCLSLTQHHRVHSIQKLPNQYDYRNVVDFDDSLFLGNEGPGCYVNDIMHYLNEGYDIPAVVRNTTSPGIGLSQGHSDQGHMEMSAHQLVTENLWAEDGAERFMSTHRKQQKAFEVSEVYALDCAYNEYGGWKFTKIKVDGKPKARTSDMAGLTSICDPKAEDTIITDISASHQEVPSSNVYRQAVTYPSIHCQTISGRHDTMIPDPKGYDQIIPHSTENVSTIQQLEGYDQTAPSSKGYVASRPDPKLNERAFHDPAGYEKNLSISKGCDSMLDIIGYDSTIKGTNEIVDTNQDSIGNVVSVPHNKGYDMLDTTGYDNIVKDTNGTVKPNQDYNGNVSVPCNKGYGMLDTTTGIDQGANQTVDIQESDGYVLTILDNNEYVNQHAELLLTWNTDQSSTSSQGVSMDSTSRGPLDSDTVRFSDDALAFDMCINDFKPVQACTFENVFEKFVSDRSLCIDSDESTDTIFVCKYCREWFVTDPDLKKHLLRHCDTACVSSAGERLTDSSFNNTGSECVLPHFNVIAKTLVDSGINIIRSLDTNVESCQSSQFEEFWIDDSSALDQSVQSEHSAWEKSTATEPVGPVDLHTHLNSVEPNVDGQGQLKGDPISYLDSLGNIKITCHQCSRAFHEDHLFCHDPCFTNKNRDLDDCGICHRKFSSYESVLTHMRAHNELANPTNCAQYSKTYQSKGMLDVHCEVHSLEHIECHICGKLVNTAEFKYHVKLHDRDVGQQRSLQCVVCEQSLPDLTALASHQYSEHSMHDDSVTDIISCYRCPHCKEEMQHKSLFIAHVASHTGVFPFECSLCLEGFFYKTLLNVHLNKYHSLP